MNKNGRWTLAELLRAIEEAPADQLAASTEAVVGITRCILELRELASFHSEGIRQAVELVQRLEGLLDRIKQARPEKWGAPVRQPPPNGLPNTARLPQDGPPKG